MPSFYRFLRPALCLLLPVFLLTQGRIYKRELHATGFVSAPEPGKK